MVAGDLNIDSDQVLHKKYGHALEDHHCWTICDRTSEKDFILSTGEREMDSSIPRAMWTKKDEHKVKPGSAHWPIAMTFRWDSGPLPSLPKLESLSTPLVHRAQALVDKARKQARHGICS